MTDFSAFQSRATEIRALFREMETGRYGRPWSRADIMAGFMGDVGDLAKIVMAQEGVRDMEDKDAKLRHELADCLWSVLVLAGEYGVDLETAFFAEMDEVEKKIKTK